jgi:hypothetical protein
MIIKSDMINNINDPCFGVKGLINVLVCDYDNPDLTVEKLYNIFNIIRCNIFINEEFF